MGAWAAHRSNGVGWHYGHVMPSAPEFLVVDTSVAIEVLIEEAPHRVAYAKIFESAWQNGSTIVCCDLLQAELLESAFTWDIRRRAGDWRRQRKQGSIVGRVPRELTILALWRRFLRGGASIEVPMRAFVDAAVPLMHERGLSSYDAIHLAVANRTGGSILTHDRFMIAAALGLAPVISMREKAP